MEKQSAPVPEPYSNQGQFSPQPVPGDYQAPAQPQPYVQPYVGVPVTQPQPQVSGGQYAQPQWGTVQRAPGAMVYAQPVPGQVMAQQPMPAAVNSPAVDGVTGFFNGVVGFFGSALNGTQKWVNRQFNWSEGIVNDKPLYVNEVDGFLFVVMDGTLRHIPDAQVFLALFNRPMDPGALHAVKFSTAPGSAAPPFPFGQPLPTFAKIIHFHGDFYLVDQVNGEAVRRHMNQGAWAKYGLAAGNNCKEVAPNEFQSLPLGPPL
jgi:hypothetical protein